jgi:hypothetical protein
LHAELREVLEPLLQEVESLNERIQEYEDLFGGNCEAAAGKFLGCFVEIRSGRSTI